MLDETTPEELVAGPLDDPDRYRLVSVRGAGGEGIVYRAELTHGDLVHDVAVKLLTAANAADWRDQVELLRSLQHPAIVTVREGFVGPDPHRPGAMKPSPQSSYVVMNWVDGPALDELIPTGALTPSAAFQMLVPVAEALELCHSGARTSGRAIVHRDVKPNNILVSARGPVLVDFGVSTAAGEAFSAGSPSFRAPEWNQGVATPALDIYGLGATVAFVLLGGANPSDDADELHHQLRESPAARLRADAVDRVIRLCSRNPNERPTDLATQLRAIANTTDFVTPGSAPTIVAPRHEPAATDTDMQSPRLVTWPILGVLAFVIGLAIVGVGIFFAGSDRNDDIDDAPAIEVSNVVCDPAAMLAAANELGVAWEDPDLDCLTTQYERDVLGSAANNPDTDADGIIDSLDADTCSNCTGIPTVGAQTAPLDVIDDP
ncbi:MAG: serine/threonine-protein kinase [Ilumatobacter sp.]